MSYNTSTSEWKIDKVSRYEFMKLIQIMEKRGVRVEATEDINGKEVPYLFNDDCFSVIDDWAYKFNLTFSYKYHDLEEGDVEYVKYIKGVRVE